MTIPRREVVYEDLDGIYHCYSRCVRRAFLCGFDSYSGNNYEHRRELILERLKFLSRIFTVEVLDYAIMTNHYHLLLRIIQKKLKELSQEEVARRWLMLYPARPGILEPSEQDLQSILNDPERLEKIRKRLGSISWFMKSVGEYIARKANKEDDCKGRFWEGRFKCQRLDSEAAVLACSCYIDLNPIRAKIANTPEESLFTGVYERIKQLKQEVKEEDCLVGEIDNRKSERGYLSMDFKTYLEIIDYTGREFVKGKKGAIPKNIAGVFERLGIKGENWVDTNRYYGKWFCKYVAGYNQLKNNAISLGRAWCKGMTASKTSFA